MRLGVNNIDKQEFLPLYQQARSKALHERNIRSGFAATGLVPFKPERVLTVLYAPVQTLLPQLQLQQANYTAATPHNIIELEQQVGLVKEYLR
jgi:hypothetical protein